MRFISNGIPIDPASIPSPFPLHLLSFFPIFVFCSWSCRPEYFCVISCFQHRIFSIHLSICFWKLVVLFIVSLECHLFSCYTLSGTSANEIVTFNGKSDVVELLSLSPYSSCTSNCIPAIFRMVVHSNQGLS